MFNMSKLKARSEQGFTLIELLVVIIIIGILAAIAIPLFLEQRKLAINASVKADVRNTVDNMYLWLADTSNSTANEVQCRRDSAGTQNCLSSGGGTPAYWPKVTASGTNTVYISVRTGGSGKSWMVGGFNQAGGKYLNDSDSDFYYNANTGTFQVGSKDAIVN